MTTTVTVSKDDLDRIIRNYIRAQGYEVQGNLTYNITASYSDSREYWPASVNSITAQAKPR